VREWGVAREWGIDEVVEVRPPVPPGALACSPDEPPKLLSDHGRDAQILLKRSDP
jgi:hypothetical protein